MGTEADYLVSKKLTGRSRSAVTSRRNRLGRPMIPDPHRSDRIKKIQRDKVVAGTFTGFGHKPKNPPCSSPSSSNVTPA